MTEFPLVQKTLPGGLRVVLLPREQVQTVTFMVLIGVGSRYETPKQNGLSHFLEHMFFKGTKLRPDKKAIAIEMDALGAEFNAFTSEEATSYYVKVAKENIEKGADVVTDILLRSLFPAKEIELERGVIIEEIRMYTDEPSRHVWHLWNRAMYGDHPLGRRIDGSEKVVSAFRRPDFLKYVKEHYHTENAVVAVAGNFEAKKMEQLLGRLLADLPRGKETFPKKAPRGGPAKRFEFERRATIDQTHVLLGVPGVSRVDSDREAAEVLATVLGGGMSSRLFLRVREDHGLAYTVRTYNEALTDTGFVVSYGGLRSDKAAFAVKLILEEYDRAMDELVPEEELAKAKQMIRGHLVIGLEETNALALFAGTQTLLEKKVETPEEVWKKIEAVTAEDVRRIARKLLKREKRALALLGPQKSPKEFEKLLRT